MGEKKRMLTAILVGTAILTSNFFIPLLKQPSYLSGTTAVLLYFKTNELLHEYLAMT